MLMPHYVGMSLCKYSCCPIVQYVHHAQHPYRNNPAIQLYKMYMSRAGELCLILGITNGRCFTRTIRMWDMFISTLMASQSRRIYSLQIALFLHNM
jgi:hypothetical protein